MISLNENSCDGLWQLDGLHQTSTSLVPHSAFVGYGGSRSWNLSRADKPLLSLVHSWHVLIILESMKPTLLSKLLYLNLRKTARLRHDWFQRVSRDDDFESLFLHHLKSDFYWNKEEWTRFLRENSEIFMFLWWKGRHRTEFWSIRIDWSIGKNLISESETSGCKYDR